MFFDVLRCIIIDFFEPVSYLLVIFAAGVLAAGFFLRIRRLTGWRIRFQISANGLCRVLLLVYLLVLLQTALFSREPGSRYSLDLTLFETWGRSAVSRAYFIENILMYLPFGILAPACFRKLERPWVCLLYTSGYKTEVLPVTTAEYGLSKAARPFNSRLDKSKLVEAGFTPLPTWQDALSRYLKEIE